MSHKPPYPALGWSRTSPESVRYSPGGLKSKPRLLSSACLYRSVSSASQSGILNEVLLHSVPLFLASHVNFFQWRAGFRPCLGIEATLARLIMLHSIRSQRCLFYHPPPPLLPTSFAFIWQDPETHVSQQLTWTVLPQGFRDNPHFFGQALQKDLQTPNLAPSHLL